MNWKPILWPMLIFTVWIGWATFAESAELTHRWKSPSFSGIGSSAHFLTIENQEFTRRLTLKQRKSPK